jgi:hypothetical protein
MDSNPGSNAPLQFDTAIPRVTPSAISAAQGVVCALCQGTIPDQYYDVNGQSVCDGCRGQLAQMTETPRNWGVFGVAGLFGLGAAIAGAILYYAVMAISNFEIGIVAIAIGFMVGWAVRKGAGGRGGRRFQVLALVLTYWAVGLAYTPLMFKQLAEENAKEKAAATAPASTPADSPDESGDGSLGLAVVVLLGLSLALPVLSVISSLPSGLISAAIIAFGMQQAWKMTGVPVMQISGPFRIAPGSSLST